MLIPSKKSYSNFLLIILIITSQSTAASSSDQKEISYQEAASYTHLLWNNTNQQPININLLPIQNFSGIPIEKRSENTEYFNHGKIPIEIDLLARSLLQSSYQLRLKNKMAGDYQFQFSLEKYQLPHQYAPDDNIWQEYKDEVDRWLDRGVSSQVKLTLNITSVNKPTLPWSKSILAQLTQCDLNKSPQPLLPFASNNKNLTQYVKSMPAQAFIAANNYLILEALKYLRSRNEFATIEKINGGELFIKSLRTHFNQGDSLSVHQENNGQVSSFPIGLVEIVKTFENQATAYPLNFKSSHVRVGDKIALNNSEQFQQPDYLLKSKNACGMVKVIDAVGS
ncbi:MAG: hypothetical protein COB38_03200 [Gammaproteobacteria bacterium]|nr:MAG: hypothetical protein COB38_03200 [Gammaproteobacteria bacterium]